MKITKHLIKINKIKSNNINEFNSYIEDLISLQKAIDDLIDNSSDVDNPNKYNTTALKSIDWNVKRKAR